MFQGKYIAQFNPVRPVNLRKSLFGLLQVSRAQEAFGVLATLLLGSQSIVRN